MIDQYQKYKDNKDVKIIKCSFHGDNRGYSYLTDLDVDVGDVVIASMKDGEMKCLTVQEVKDSSHIMPNPPFKKYAWVCQLVDPSAVSRYKHIDDDIGVVSHAEQLGAVAIPKLSPPKDDVDDKMKAIFG